MKISLVIPSRNNRKYFKWAYDSIRKNQGDHEVYICAADDASTDGTAEYFEQLAKDDPYFSYFINYGPNRIGLTVLYNRIVEELVQTDIAMIYHADMYLAPGALDAIERLIEPKTIVSLTRIEPPLHPAGPEKVIWPGGVEPEDFKEDEFLAELPKFINSDTKTTEGVFAPWAFYKKDFQEVEGHDPLFSPQTKEDSDIFNRFQLNGIKFIQTWEGFVYHLTSRGNRRNVEDGATSIYVDNPQWVAQNRKSHNNFIRKWGHHVLHDQHMKPIIPNKYDIALIIDPKSNIPDSYIKTLEPYFSCIYLTNENFVKRLLNDIQPTTSYDMKDRIKVYSSLDDRRRHHIEVYLHPTSKHLLPLTMIPQILDQGHEEGEFDLEGLDITVHKANTYLKIPNRVLLS